MDPLHLKDQDIPSREFVLCMEPADGRFISVTTNHNGVDGADESWGVFLSHESALAMFAWLGFVLHQ